MLCACGTGKLFSECCEPYITGKKNPQTAEQMMRSRYTAFTVLNMDYVWETNDPQTRNEADMDANRKWAESVKWLGLEVLEVREGEAGASQGTVRFKAKFEHGGKVEEHHELSEFRSEGGRWFFVDGKDPRKVTVVREKPKIGPNEPCPCGSGKKFKKCCGN